MNRLLTVTISALFLVLLILSVSFDSHAYDMEDLFEDECIDLGYPAFTAVEKDYINRGFQYDFLVSGPIDGYQVKSPGYQYYTANGPLEFEFSNGYQRFVNHSGQDISAYSISLKIDGTYSKQSHYFPANSGPVFVSGNHIRTAYPYQGELPAMNSNVTHSDFLMQPDTIPQNSEFLYITNPPEAYKTIDRFVKYTINYSILATSVNDLAIQIRNQNNQILDDDPKVKSYYIDAQTATQDGPYNRGITSIIVEYENVTGPIGITATVVNNVTNRQLQLIRNCELADFTDSNGDGIDDNTGQDEFNRDEMIVIAAPKLNEKTVNRMVPLNFYIRIKGDNYNTILQNTKIFYKNSVSGQYEDIFLSEILNDTNVHINNKNQLRLFNFYKVGEYITLNFTCNLLFEDTFLGDIPLRISTTSDTTGKQITVFHKFSLVAFIDANNDGIDDNTGEVYDPNPQLPDYSDDELTLDGAIGTLKNVIPFLQSALSTIIIIISVLFGWLPPEIMFLITAIVTLIGVSVIVKIIRG